MGIRLRAGSQARLARPQPPGIVARGVVGLRASFGEAPFDLFLEPAPVGIAVVSPEPGAYCDVDVALVPCGRIRRNSGVDSSDPR